MSLLMLTCKTCRYAGLHDVVPLGQLFKVLARRLCLAPSTQQCKKCAVTLPFDNICNIFYVYTFISNLARSEWYSNEIKTFFNI